jgi:hypothetical protein
MFVYVGGDWRRGFEYARQEPDPEPDEGPGLTWRQLPPLVRHLGHEDPRHRHPRRRRLGRLPPPRGPPGLSSITTVGRFGTVEAALLATDEVWAAR